MIVFLLGYILGPKVSNPSRSREFRYGYLRHPFDNMQYFTVTALDQKVADAKAQKHFVQLFEEGKTVTTTFYPLD